MEKTVLAFAESALALSDPEEERAAHHAPTLDHLGHEDVEKIARVAYRIAQVEAERARQLVPAAGIRPWKDMDERTRANARATVVRIVQALVVTGWLER